MKEKTKFSKSKEVSKNLFLISRSMTQPGHSNFNLMNTYLFFPACYYYSYKNTKDTKAKIEGFKIYWPIDKKTFNNINYSSYSRIEAYRLYDKIYLDKNNIGE